MSLYEITAIYDKEYGEVIVYESDTIMHDSNDIIKQAVKIGLLEPEYIDKVRWAKCISKYDYEHSCIGKK